MSTAIPPNAGSAPGGFVNGKLLDTAHWAATVKNLDPSTHRLRNCYGLSMGLIAGRQLMNVATGSTPSGETIDKKDLPVFIQPLHGALAYDHFSDDPKDRWMKVFDNWLPGVMGGVGAMLGSYDFAMDPAVGGIGQAAKAAEKNLGNLTIDKAELLSKFTQSHPWRGLSGLTSMFGSASGFGLVPGINNYGATLGGSFIGVVGRDKLQTPYFPALAEFISGNKHPFPFGPASMLGRMQNVMVHNTAKDPKQARDMAYAILEPWFGEQVTERHVSDFVKEVHAARDKFFREGGVPENLKADCEKELHKVLTGVGLEKTFRKIGLNPETASIGRNGFIEFMSRMLGYGERLDDIGRNYRKAYAARNNISIPLEDLTRATNHPHDAKTLMAGGAVVALGAALVGGIALEAAHWHKQDNHDLLECKKDALIKTVGKTDNLMNSLAKGAGTGGAQALPAFDKAADVHAGIADRFKHQREVLASRKAKAGQGFSSWINDKPLEYMELATDGLNSPESVGMHRASVATGLTAFGLVGMKVAEALTGRNFAGANVPIDKVHDVLHPLYKKLAYNPFSDHPKDKWGYVTHLAIPSLFATLGAVTGSTLFFQKRQGQVKKAEFIDEFENKATMAEAGPWTLLTATSALLATPSGNVFLPIPGINYGMSLGTRFTLSSGRKVIFPGLGEKWSGNASRYPYGPAALRDLMVKYAVNNKTPHPEQLEEMAIGILRPWFENVTGEQVLAFVNKVEEDRDRFLKEGGVPEESKKDLEKLLIAHFKGAGLEGTLREIGLDPLKATLGNNGVSATIARYLGAEKPLQEIHQEFADKYTARLMKDRSFAAQSAPQPSYPA